MNENAYITDPVLRRYLGLDEIGLDITWRTKNKKHIPLGNSFTNYQKTGIKYMGREQIWLPYDEYAEVSSIFNSYVLPEGEIFLTKEIYSYGGYARY